MEKKIKIKSLENFNKNRRVHVVPFRYKESNFEIYLHKTKTQELYEDFNDFIYEFDPTPIFAGSRILIQQLYAQSFALDENGENWIDSLFQRLLGLIASSYENYQSEENIYFFINEKNWNEFILHDNPLFKWCSITDIKNNPGSYTRNLIDELKILDMQAYIEFQPKKLYAIINCEKNTKWDNIYEGLYQGHLQIGHEQWLSFNVNKGVFPSEEEIAKINGWVITGSASATYDQKLLWLQGLFKLLNDIVKIKGKNARILGICFGHQALAKAFGGETGPMGKSLYIKQKVFFNEKFTEKAYVKRSGIPAELLLKQGIFINQIHGDHVSKIPPNAEHFGFSDNTNIECFGIGEEILGIQPHPEFCDYLMLYKLIHYTKTDEETRKNLVKSYTEWEIHNKELMKICREFLNI